MVGVAGLDRLDRLVGLLEEVSARLRWVWAPSRRTRPGAGGRCRRARPAVIRRPARRLRRRGRCARLAGHGISRTSGRRGASSPMPDPPGPRSPSWRSPRPGARPSRRRRRKAVLVGPDRGSVWTSAASTHFRRRRARPGSGPGGCRGWASGRCCGCRRHEEGADLGEVAERIGEDLTGVRRKLLDGGPTGSSRRPRCVGRPRGPGRGVLPGQLDLQQSPRNAAGPGSSASRTRWPPPCRTAASHWASARSLTCCMVMR